MIIPLKIAVSTGSLWPVPTLESIKLLQNQQIRNIELMLQMEDFFLNFKRKFIFNIKEELLDLVQSGELSILSIHAPAIPTEHGFSSRACRDYLLETVRVCYELGASTLVVHPFHLFTTYEQSLDYLQGRNPDIWQALLPGIREVFDFALKKKVRITLENILIWGDDQSEYFNHPRNMLRFLQDTDKPCLGMTLDLHHACFGKHLDAFFDLHQNSILNLHLSDVNASLERVPPGKGDLLNDTVLNKIRNLPGLKQITLELNRSNIPEIEDGVSYLQEKLFQKSSAEIAAQQKVNQTPVY